MKKHKRLLLLLFLAAALMLTSMSTLATATPDEYGTQREYIVSLLKAAGMKDNVIGTSAADRDALADSLGFLDNWNYTPTAIVTDEVKVLMDAAMSGAYNGLAAALAKRPMEPYFVHGLAQPIFYYGNSTYYDTSGEGVVRFLVYVETDFDTDGDGKLDLVKVMVQLPRACIDQGMKVGTVYHAQPYNEGTNDGVSYPTNVRSEGTNWLNQNGPFTHEKLHGTAPPRVPVGEMSTKEAVEKADWRDWRYNYTYAGKPATTATVVWGVTNGNQVSSLNMHDYLAVRGFALVSTAGIGTLVGDGISTYGADIEIAAYKKVIDWLNGRATAYTDKTSNIEIKADWSNGLVGMTGTSYGGTVPVGVASTGVEGLECIVPVCGIISYYEYQNQQGAVNWRAQYTPGMVWYILSSFGRADWNTQNPVRGKQMGYMQQMFYEALDLNGTYGEHWARRDYSLDGWYEDWGPSKMKANMMIVAGLNDNNVRPKQCVLMYEATQKAGVEGRLIWMQGAHTTPNNQMIGEEYTYQDWLNLWFSHHLFKVDNNVLEKLPEVYAQSNLNGNYVAYDSWKTDYSIVLDNSNRVGSSSATPPPAREQYEEPQEYTGIDYYLLGGYDEDADYSNIAQKESTTVSVAEANNTIAAPPELVFAAPEESYTTLNSANGNATWTNFLNAPTAGSMLYSYILPYDATVEGVVEVHFRAAVTSLGSNFGSVYTTTEAPPQAKVHAKLVEVAATGTTVTAFGANSVGTGPGSQNVVTGGVFRGGGLTSANISRYTSSTFPYRELARGHMSLAHPGAGYDSRTAGPESYIDLRQNIGVYHDYTLYLQPTVHTAKKGNRLALIITIGHPSNDAIVTGAATGNVAFTFNVDNNATYTVIPLAAPMTTFNVSFMDGDQVYENQIVSYLNAAKEPDTPKKAGYRFDGWFAADGQAWDFSTIINEDVQIFAKWTKYNYTVSLISSKTNIFAGETFQVDVMLSGDINYTQLAAELAYDANLLTYVGYSDLKGLVAAVSMLAPNKVSVRSIPSLNMIFGESCTPDVKIVTLNFMANTDLLAKETAAGLAFAQAVVNPPAGFIGALTEPCEEVSFTLYKIGNEYLQSNLAKFPEMYDINKGQTKPIFSNATDRVIQEEVWIEVPLDTDKDGKRDLMRVRFRRPIETRTAGLKTPVIAQLTPYSGANATFSSAFGGKVDTDYPGENNPDTRNIKYEDLRYDGLRYKDLLAKDFGDLSEWGIPDARTPLSSQREGAATASWSPTGWHAYFIPLGYTCASVEILGCTYAEGILTYGGYEENIAAAALVDWLNGRIKGYTSPTSLIEVETPYWATGEVAMSGTSYGGQLPFGAAVTGVEGLRTIIPFAAPTSSYEYYRANGGVYAPGAYQGEDVSEIVVYCFGRGWTGSTTPTSPVAPTQQVWQNFYKYVGECYEGQDRTTGDYSAFWDARNIVSFGEDARKDLGIILFHGLNDDNVKFKNGALMYDMCERYGITAKAIFHQGNHTSGQNHNGLNFYPDIHKWFDYYLFGVENGMPEAFPDIRVQSNVDISWKSYSKWPMGTYQKFYPNGSGRVGVLSATAPAATSTLKFKDTFILSLTRPNYTIPTPRPWDTLYTENALKYAGHAGNDMAASQYYRWRNYMLGGGNATTSWSAHWTMPASVTYDLTQALDDRLLYAMDITEDITISGTIKMTAKVAADKKVGAVSAMLVDIGSERRYGTSTSTTGNVVGPDGTTVNLVSWAQSATASPGRIFSRGLVDVQNPNWDGKIWSDCRETNWMAPYTYQTTAITPGEFYPYTWELDVTDYTLLKGHKLVLLLFGSDPEYTLRPYNPTEFTVEIGSETYISLPLINLYTPPDTLPALEFVLETSAENEIDEIVEEILTETVTIIED
ncbi:MAG: InlB B-repeat-containing protein [Firmicutes bacterium]|nr:InlB B-repeat-containing protein [Bacillota bacterium]